MCLLLAGCAMITVLYRVVVVSWDESEIAISDDNARRGKKDRHHLFHAMYVRCMALENIALPRRRRSPTTGEVGIIKLFYFQLYTTLSIESAILPANQQHQRPASPTRNAMPSQGGKVKTVDTSHRLRAKPTNQPFATSLWPFRAAPVAVNAADFVLDVRFNCVRLDLNVGALISIRSQGRLSMPVRPETFSVRGVACKLFSLQRSALSSVC